MIKTLVKKALYQLGFELQRIDKSKKQEDYAGFSMEGCLGRSRQRVDAIQTVIDIGASNGCWSELCMKFYPNAHYYLIEAQAPHEASLTEFVKKNRNANYVLKAAGNKTGKIYFDAGDLFSGVASETPFEKNNIEVFVTTIDHEVKEKNLKGPFLIKLDTHGYEIPILEGAETTLKETKILIIEAYNFRLNENAFKFYELCQYLDSRGFLPVDIADLMSRKKDRALWQMDIFFEKADGQVFSSNGFE